MPTTDDLSRFDRLILGWGEEAQNKVAQSYITVITDSVLAKYLASYLVSAGFGNLRLVGNVKRNDNSLWAIPLEDELQTDAYAKALPALCPGIRVQVLHARMNNSFLEEQIRQSNAIVDATNSSLSKAWTLDAGIANNLPAISVSCIDNSARLQVFNPKNKFEESIKRQFLMEEYNGKPQDELVAMAIAGIVDEQVKRFTLGETVTMDSLIYKVPIRPTRKALEKYKVLVVGCGAAASPGTYALAKMGFNMDLVDDDTIKSTNLPRTPLFMEKGKDFVGESKAITLQNQLKKLFPGLEIAAFDTHFNSNFKKHDYLAVIGMVDNDAARGQIYYFSMKHNLPYLDIGTSFDGFNYGLTIPKKTACMKHYIPGFEEQVRASEAIIRASCMQTEPSNSWMQAAAVMGVLQLPTILKGKAFNGMIYYDASKPNITTLEPGAICDCWRAS
jgi:molybdopterin/thiamine biosynthesis adenylyltransferase